MKNKINIPIISILILVGCNNKNTNLTTADSLNIAAQYSKNHPQEIYKNIFGFDSTVKRGKMKLMNTAIPNDLVNDAITLYENKYFNSLDTTFIKNAYTKSVNFSSDALMEWMAINRVLFGGNNTRICFGVYTQKMIDKYPAELNQEHLGRLTAFVRLYKDDVLLNLNGKNGFNLGGLEPTLN